MHQRRVIAACLLPLALSLGASACAQRNALQAGVLQMPQHAFDGYDQDALSDAITTWLRPQIAQSMGATQLTVTGVWGWTNHSTGPWKLIKLKQQDQGDRKAYTAVLTQLQEQTPAAQVTVRLVARKQVPVWRLSRAAAKHQAIPCDAMAPDLSISPPARPWRGDCSTLIGLVTRHPLSEGMVLTLDDLIQAPAVQARQSATVTTRINAVSIEAQAEILADANVGEFVPIRLQGQSRVLRAQVVSPGQLLIAEIQQ